MRNTRPPVERYFRRRFLTVISTNIYGGGGCFRRFLPKDRDCLRHHWKSSALQALLTFVSESVHSMLKLTRILTELREVKVAVANGFTFVADRCKNFIASGETMAPHVTARHRTHRCDGRTDTCRRTAYHATVA